MARRQKLPPSLPGPFLTSTLEPLTSNLPATRHSPGTQFRFSCFDFRPNSCLLTSFQTLLPCEMCTPFLFNKLQTPPPKTPGVGVDAALRISLPTSNLQCLPFDYCLRTLPFSVSSKPFLCHSYEKCRGDVPFFPFWFTPSFAGLAPERFVGRAHLEL